MRFFRDEKGAVTVYAIIVIAALFVLNAVLIDYARIANADYDAEQAMRSALRSALSAYDRKLAEFGLFGMALNNAATEQTISDVLNGNVSGNGTGGDRWIDTRIESDSLKVDGMYKLADHAVFMQQILEKMKYAAPIEFTTEVTGKFSSMEDPVKQTQTFTKSAERLERLIMKREDAMDDVWRQLTGIHDLISIFRDTYAKEIGKLNLSDNGAVSAMHKKAGNDFQELQQLNDELDEQLKPAEKYNRDLADELDLEGNEEFEIVQIYDEDFFLKYRQTASQIVSIFGTFVNKLTESSSKEQLQQYNDEYEQQSDQLYRRQQVEEEQRSRRNGDIERQKREKREETENELKKAAQRVAAVCSSDDIPHYNALGGEQGLFEKYISYNERTRDDNPDPSFQLAEGADKVGKSALTLLQHIGEAMKTLRDEIFVNEYALMMFEYQTSSESAQSDEPSRLPHMLRGQEAEYILYGFPTCVMNTGAAYAEMFLVRMGVRTIEALSDPKTKAAASPLLMILIALAQGAVKAYADMEKLMDGKQVELTKAAPAIKLGYKDYLRLFMLLHSREPAKLSRMQALIELNTGIDLLSRVTYIKLDTAASVKLWFIPEIVKLLQEMNVLGGAVKERRFVMSKTMVLSY